MVEEATDQCQGYRLSKVLGGVHNGSNGRRSKEGSELL